MPANIMLPTKAKMAAFVCSGRRRPKVSQDTPRFACQNESCVAMMHAQQQGHRAPDDGRDGEGPHDVVIVDDGAGLDFIHGH